MVYDSRQSWQDQLKLAKATGQEVLLQPGGVCYYCHENVFNVIHIHEAKEKIIDRCPICFKDLKDLSDEAEADRKALKELYETRAEMEKYQLRADEIMEVSTDEYVLTVLYELIKLEKQKAWGGDVSALYLVRDFLHEHESEFIEYCDKVTPKNEGDDQ